MTLPLRNGKLEIEAPTDEQAKQCARMLKDHSMKWLELRCGTITRVGAGAIAKSLKGNATLRHLGLQGNDVGDVGVTYFGRAMETNPSTALAYLDLSSTGITVLGLKDLVQGVAKLPGLQMLCLSGNNLAQEAGHQLSILLRASPSLHTIVAADNYLGDRGLAALGGALCHLRPVRVVSLDVSGNGVGDLGVDWLTKGISALCRQKSMGAPTDSGTKSSRSFGGIRDLRLRGNSITHAGARELAKLFSEDRCARELRELDLSFNTITADGFRPLVGSLCRCPELARLEVAGCRLGPGGVESAATLLASARPHLTKIDLTPKAEFADRVLSDCEGLAVALRHSLQRVADSLPFAGTVLELGLGTFLRADPEATASIEATLRERREKAGVAGEVTGSEPGGRRNNASRPLSSEKPHVTVRSGTTASGSSRTRNPGADAGGGSGSSRRDVQPQRNSGSAVSRLWDKPGQRTTGLERTKLGAEQSRRERSKVSTVERATRNIGVHGPSRTTSSAGATQVSSVSSLARTPKKPPTRGAGAGLNSGRSTGTSSVGTTPILPATPDARDKTVSPCSTGACRRAHQGDEQDSLNDLTQTQSPLQARSLSFARGQSQPVTRVGRLSPTVRRGSLSSFTKLANGDGTVGGGGSGRRKGSATRTIHAVAAVVSEVMGDTAAISDCLHSPLPVAPSTWNVHVNGPRPVDSPLSIASTPPVVSKSLVHVQSTGCSRDANVREIASGSVNETDGTELVEGMESLELVEGCGTLSINSDSAQTASHQTALDLSSEAASQQLLTVAQAGQLIEPMVAHHVAKATNSLELKFKNELDTCMISMKEDLQAIDREGLVARVALEKRLTSSLKRLLDRIGQLERRFDRVQHEDRRHRVLASCRGSSEEEEDHVLTIAKPGSGMLHVPRRARPSPQPGSRSAQAAGGWWDRAGVQDVPTLSGSENSCSARSRSRSGSRVDGAAVAKTFGTSREAWGEEANGVGGDISVGVSDDDLGDTADEAEADLVRRLEEKMAALEDKLLGHEERQRNERGASFMPDMNGHEVRNKSPSYS